VPYLGATLKDAAHEFCEALNRVLNTTVTKARLVEFGPKDQPNARRLVTFRQAGSPMTATLNTRFGPMGLHIGQVCDSVETQQGRRFVTAEYRYTLTPEGVDEALLRWEYIRQPEGPWCRHHLQGRVPLALGRGEPVSMNALHLPTGYVTIEEVLRFCIVDLGVAPLSNEWDAILTTSYEKFKVEEGKL
jgi:hypothetical protein